MQRRDFLKKTALLTAGVGVDFTSSSVVEASNNNSEKLLTEEFGRPRRLSLLQGYTTENSTQIAIIRPKALNIQYKVIQTDSSQEISTLLILSQSKDFSSECVDQIFVYPLQLNRTYELQVYTDKGVIDRRYFKSLDRNKKRARIALLSCMNDYLGYNIKEMWSQVQRSHCDMLILLGDNVYGDYLGLIHGPRVLWHRYIVTRRNLPFYQWEHLVPTLAIWDDHDFGQDGATSSYEHRTSSLNIFKSFYAQNIFQEGFIQGPGVAHRVNVFNHTFIFLDGRYFRSAQGEKAESFLFGREQMYWLDQNLKSAQGATLICSGSQFFGDHQSRKDSFQKWAPHEFSHWLHIMKKTHQPVLLASGDIHHSEIQQIKRKDYGFESYEISSSCLHSLESRQLKENRRRIQGTLKNNFIFIDFNEFGHYTATCVNSKGIRFETDLQFSL